MPAEEEGCVTAESNCADESIPVGLEPQLDQRNLNGC
jgi:hypothetical protein